MIIYPAIDLQGGQCVRLMQGDFNRKTVYYADPTEAAQRWQAAGAAWLHVVDLDGAKTGGPVNDEAIKKILAAVPIPIQVGGGNRTLGDIEHRLEMGVTRVILGTSALRETLLKEAVAKYGERVAIGVDTMKGMVAVSAWQTVSDMPADVFLAQLKDMGARHVIYTDIDKDCMMGGPNFDMYGAAVQSGLSVIASGGVASMDDLLKLASMGLAGAIIGKALYVGAIDLEEAIKRTQEPI